MSPAGPEPSDSVATREPPDKKIPAPAVSRMDPPFPVLIPSVRAAILASRSSRRLPPAVTSMVPASPPAVVELSISP